MRILVCGGSHSDVPQIEAARSLGHWVATTGKYPDELGHRYADAYFPADYSDPSAIKQIVRDQAIDAVLPCCNDFSYMTCTEIAPQLGQTGFDSLETARKIHDKDAFRKICTTLRIDVPRVLANLPSERDLPSSFDTEVIVKPVDLSGGKGMTRLSVGQNPINAVKFAMDRSKVRRVVIEEFVKGTNHGMSSLIIRGKVCFNFIDNEHYFLNPYLVSGASTPSNVRPEVARALVADIEKLASSLRLVDGLMHCQFIQTDLGYRLLEICRRPPGDLYTRFVELATDLPYPELLVRFYLGQVPDELELAARSSPRHIIRHCAMAANSGRYVGLSIGPRVINQVIESMSLLDPGSEITDVNTQKAAIVFIGMKGQSGIFGEDLPAHIKVVVEK
jgi:biotin carboxylase